MKKIKLDFVNWWGFGLDEWSAMFKFLDYDFVMSGDPDYIVYSNTALRYMPDLRFGGKKIFFMGEIIDADMSMCDWAFGDNYIDDPRHFRMPYYVIRMLYTGTPLDSLIKNIDVEEVLSQKDGFCNFVFSNTNDGTNRNEFFEKLSKYKKVDSVGLSLNNMGYVLPGRAGTKVGHYVTYPEKAAFLSRYKFTIAFENNRSDYNPDSGYTTEKITEAMLAGSIPIYRGNSRIGEEFNAKSFLNRLDFDTDEELIERIIELDNDDSLYMDMQAEPWLKENKLTKQLDIEAIRGQFERIFGRLNS